MGGFDGAVGRSDFADGIREMESKKRTSVFFAPLFEYRHGAPSSSCIHDQASLSLGFFPQLHRIPHSDVEIIECVVRECFCNTSSKSGREINYPSLTHVSRVSDGSTSCCLRCSHFGISSDQHTIPAMDACNLPLATPTDKYALSVQLTTSSNARSANAKFDQKMSAATPLSNRESDGATTAKKEALAKQFLASHATMVMAQPSNFRR
ncbi:hypothetical protein PC120_g21391 [Phytophthora cactorum]|nr:hypothetical protein PC120_g21391 [Phytophthora cactorum]